MGLPRMPCPSLLYLRVLAAGTPSPGFSKLKRKEPGALIQLPPEFHGCEANPPNTAPWEERTSTRVGPLLSHLLWNACGPKPSLLPLNSSSQFLKGSDSERSFDSAFRLSEVLTTVLSMSMVRAPPTVLPEKVRLSSLFPALPRQDDDQPNKISWGISWVWKISMNLPHITLERGTPQQQT